MPETKLKNVLFPDPLGPIIPLISFLGSSKSTLLIAFKPPNDFNISTNYLSSSDFDLFVLRVHVLSSLENAETIADAIKKGGYPSFIETFGTSGNLHAVYVGPFLTEKEIKDNLEEIQNISESSQSEITKWKL